MLAGRSLGLHVAYEQSARVPGALPHRRVAVERIGGLGRGLDGCADLDLNLRFAHEQRKLVRKTRLRR